MDIHCEGDTGEGLFCKACQKVRNRDDLKSVKFVGYTGLASINPNMETFLNTGDPAAFEKHGH